MARTAKTFKVDHEKDQVPVFIAPEQLAQQRVREAAEAGESPERIAEVASQRFGEYRAWFGEEVIDNLSVPKYGDRLVWVDEEPDNQEGGDGHFENYDEDVHGEYRPVIRKGADV